MPLHKKVDDADVEAELEINPVYVSELSCEIPRYRLPERGVFPRTALQVVRDELILDGNARLNLATFVTTWMEAQADRLMAECVDKNMIDKDEYPQTAELEGRCVRILANLWHAPDAPSTWMGTSRPVVACRSSSAAAMPATGSKLPSKVDPKMATTPIVSSSQRDTASGAVRWNRSPSIGTIRASTSQ